MEISPEDFIKLTTEGYPILIKHPKKEFFELFATFVNESTNNDFFAEHFDNSAKVHAGMKTEICEIFYEEGHVLISSNININDFSSTGEFEASEEYLILGHACLGVLYFCDLYALGTGQNAKISGKNINQISRPKKNINNNNTKHDIWPI